MSVNRRPGGLPTSAECLTSRMDAIVTRRHAPIAFTIAAQNRTSEHVRGCLPLALLRSMAKPAATETPRLIAENRKARFDYFIEERYEAGLVLQGWEVKSMRAGRAQLKESYVYVKNGEAFLFGAHLSPLNSASSHVVADPIRTRKLLLNAKELTNLAASVERE